MSDNPARLFLVTVTECAEYEVRVRARTEESAIRVAEDAVTNCGERYRKREYTSATCIQLDH